MGKLSRALALFCAAAALCWALPFGAGAASPLSSLAPRVGVRPISIAEKAVDPKYQDVSLTGVRPSAIGGSEAARAELNKRFDAQYNNFLKRHAAGGVKRLSFEVKQVGGAYVSVLFYCTVDLPTNSEEYVAATVLDDTGRVLAISDVLGADAVKLINRDLAAKIAMEPKRYNPAFAGIDDDHDFYMADDRLVIPFGEFELLASPSGIVERVFKPEDFKTMTLERKDYAVKTEYAVKMMPLRAIADAFGYTVIWDAANSAVAVTRDKTPVAQMKIDENRYAADPAGVKRSLEAAPELRDGKTYVPLSFCEDYLALCARVAPGGAVTFTAYLPQ